MVDMNDAVRQQLVHYGTRNGLNEKEVQDMIEIFETFGHSSEIHPEALAQMLDINMKTYRTFLAMVGESLDHGLKNDDEITAKDLMIATFSSGVSFGMMMEGGLRRG